MVPLHRAPDVFRRGVTLDVAWFGKDALIDRWRLYKIAHQASTNDARQRDAAKAQLIDKRIIAAVLINADALGGELAGFVHADLAEPRPRGCRQRRFARHVG